VQARVRSAPEDFVVEEIPAYEPSGEGDHRWLWIEKRGRTTLQVIDDLAVALGRRGKEFGYAGLKDSQAVTRQWISIEHVPEAALQALALPGVQVLRCTRHKNRLKLGHLHGNRFSILLRGVEAGGEQALAANLEDLARRGAPNWFGEQRFGHHGRNLDKGLAILRGDPRQAAMRMSRRLLSLLVSAVQSEVFNRVLRARLLTIDCLLPGDVAFLHRNGACFVVLDLAAEQARCDRLELSPSGPLPGPRVLAPRGEPLAIEMQAMAELGITAAQFGRMPHGTHLGARRSLRMRVHEPQVAREGDGVRLRFALDRGCYATAVLSELVVGTTAGPSADLEHEVAEHDDQA
jgi:tRNA pseudouridine13 synthase